MTDEKNSVVKSFEKKNSQVSIKVEPNVENNIENQNNNKDKPIDLKKENIDKNIETFEKCDGCFKPQGSIYCLVCEKNFCQNCDNQAHILPAYSKHERIPLSQMAHVRITCVNHKLPLRYYCESCNDPICTECSDKGSHSNKLHKISPIIDSFRMKYSFLQTLVNQHLFQKNEQLIDQIQIIEQYSNEVKNKKLEIEREIKREYLKIIENLKNEEGKKLSVLQYESSVLQKEIENINDFANYLKELGQGTPDMIGFLLMYKKLSENIENCIAKPIKKNIDIRLDDLPNEVQERNIKLLKYEKMKKLVQIKEDIIWNMILDKKERHDEEVINERENHQNELNELNKVIDNLCLLFKKYELVCHFCGVKLEEGTINTGCHRNIPESSSRTYSTGMMKEYYSTSSIPIEYVGNKRHYFGHPNRPINNNKNNLLSSNAFLQFSHNFSSPKKDLNNSSYLASQRNIKNTQEEVNVSNVLEKMKNIACNKQTTVLELFRSDFRESDIVSQDNIKSFLKKTFNLEEKEIIKFLSNFKSNSFLNNNQYSSIINNISYSICEIFNYMKSKQLNNNYKDTKVTTIPDAGVVYAERISEWIFKVAKLIQRNSINLFSMLTAEDKNEDGYLNTDDLRISFTKLKLNLNTNDIETMINYFGYQNNDRINIEEFTKNFMAHLNENINF